MASSVLARCHDEADKESKLLDQEEVRNVLKRQAETDKLCKDICKRLGDTLDDATREWKTLKREKERIRSTEEAAKTAVDMASRQAIWNGCWANSKAAEVEEMRQWLYAERLTNDELRRALAEKDRVMAEKDRVIFEYKQRYGLLPLTQH